MNEPRSVLVAGATRGVGVLVVKRLQVLGIGCRVLARDRKRAEALGGVDIVEGDALIAADCARAVEGCDAVVCTIGEHRVPRDRPIVDGIGVIQLADAAVAAGIRRFVLVSTLGAGDSWRRLPFPVRWYFRIFDLVPIVEEKTRSETHVRTLDLDWTILRPGQLTNLAMRARPLLTSGGRAGGTTTRQAVADVAVRCLRSPNAIGKVLTVLDRAMCFTAVGSPRFTLDTPWQPWG